jgi:hypothetical protein
MEKGAQMIEGALGMLLLGIEGDGAGAAGAAAAVGGLLGALVGLAFAAAMIAGMWKVFEKAGKPGWAAIVPIYNIIVLLEIVGRPIWWIVLFFVPCANFVAIIMVSMDLARKFGQGAGYAVGLVVLPFVFYPMLGFGDARYQPNA